MIDLHTHSTCSDGQLTPAALVAAAAARGVTTLALTDHDTVAGLAEIHTAGAAHGVRTVAGVEISTTWKKRTLHVVGLAFDPPAGALAGGLRLLQEKRAERAAAMAVKLEKQGLADALRRAQALASDGHIARPHFARLLIEDGLCKDMQQAFKRYLKPGKPGHAAIEWVGLEEAIHWIHAANGIAVLAHPFGYDLTGAWRRRAIAAFAAAQGDAMEICTGTTDRQQEITAGAFAREHGLLASIGSDFHAPEQFWLALGRLRPLPADLPTVWDDPRFTPLA